MIFFSWLPFCLILWISSTSGSKIIRTSVGLSTLIETSPDTYGFIYPRLTSLESDFIVVNGHVLEKIYKDCTKSSTRLDRENETLTRELEDLRETFEEGRLYAKDTGIPIVREIYADNGLLASRIQIGPHKSQSAQFKFRGFKVHQLGDDFTYIDEVSDEIERIFLISDTLVQVFVGGQVSIEALSCIPQARQKRFIHLLYNLRKAGDLHNKCLEEYSDAMKEAAAVYHTVIDRLNTSLRQDETTEEQKSQARMVFDSQRKALLEVREKCLAEIENKVEDQD